MVEIATTGSCRARRRRDVLKGGAALALSSALPWRRGLADEAPKVLIVSFSAAGERQPAAEMPKIVLSDAEWKAKLSSESYEVARHAGTERPFTGTLLGEHRKGIFHCICCDTALFSSTTKFESGTGWPSFWEPIAKENVHEKSDRSFGMERTEVTCARCDAHLGHVFDDGPRPTGLRYCMNSVSLTFAPIASA
jgi:peptide-methionine (R)-S-oxide reductase